MRHGEPSATRLLFTLLAVVCIAGAPAASAPDGGGDAPGRATLAVTPLAARIGDPLSATLELELPAGGQFDPPPLEASFGPFAVLSGGWTGPETAGGAPRWTWRGTLAAYETGTLKVPAIGLQVTHAGTIARVRTEPLDVTIESVLPPEGAGADTGSADISDLKAPVSVAPDYRRLWTALAIVGALLAGAAAVWWVNRRYAGRLAAVPAPEDPFRRTPPHHWAYEELQRLVERRLPESGEFEQFFAALSWIVKRYLSGRFRVDLMEHTTEEVAPRLQQAGAPAGPMTEIRALLARCDLVKFAKQGADLETCRAALAEAYVIVDRTKPAEAPAAAPAPGAA